MQTCLKNIEPWLILSNMPGMRSQLFNKLLQIYKTPENILSCDPLELLGRGIKAELRAAILHYQQTGKLNSSKVEKSLLWAENEHHYIFTQNCSEYPRLLKQIPDPPPILYVKGRPDSLSLPQLAMVGSRNPSFGGRKLARLFAQQLCACGYAIASGMAAGVDYESHRGALEHGGVTLAVLGSGIDTIYPKQHHQLAEEIVEHGALISEFPLGTKPNAWNFPQRNRIVTGLSHGVLVIEAALRSGSLISARLALEQGREVFALPGSINNPNTKGCHYLIKQGAKLVEKVEDVVEELEAFFHLAQGDLVDKASKHFEHKNKSNKNNERPGVGKGVEQGTTTACTELTINASLILAAVDYDGTTADSLVANTGLKVSEINAKLIELEVAGLIVLEARGYCRL